MKNCFLLLFLLFFSLGVKSQIIDDIRTEARAAFLEGASMTEGYYFEFYDDLHADGYFIDEVEYPCFNPGDCDPTDDEDLDDILKYKFNGKHLKLLAELTKARALKQNDPSSSTFPSLDLEELETKIVAGLNWWYQTIPYYHHAANGGDGIPNVGWWWNEIGKQRELQIISVLFDDYLNDPANSDPNNENNILLKTPGTSTLAPIAPPVYPATVNECIPEEDIEDYVPQVITTNIANIKDAISADFQITIQDLDDDDNHTGANKADVAGSIVAKGLIENCITYVNLGKLALECVMNFATEAQKRDGVREDYSFNQHNKENQSGPDGVRRGFLYSGGYGMSFMHNVAVWGKAFTGDPNYDYLDGPKKNFFRYMLEGYRWMLIGDMTDYSANGRDIAKRYPSSNADIPNEDMALIVDMAAGSAYLSDLMAMQSELGGRQNIVDADGSSLHHKHFWKSDYVVHQEDAYFSSLRMCSDRTLGTEEHGGDNSLGFWLPYGCTFIYQDGDEYIRSANENIFPFWNWSYVPGVTCSVATDPENELEPVNNDNSGQGNTQTETFVGNASNDSYGVSAMSFDKDYYGGNVTAKKAWFHFGEEVIALGAGINGNEDLHTTINQCLLESTSGIQSSGDAYYINHDGIAYILPDGPMPAISTANQSGNWNDINNDCDDDNDDCSASGNVFRLWIDHGSATDADYFYIIAPGQDATEYVNRNPVRLIRNDATSGSYIQAVTKTEADGDLLAGIIWYPHPDDTGLETVNFTSTYVPITGSLEVKTNKPCALIYDSNTGQICISSPYRDESNITLTVRETINGGSVEFTNIPPFDLPDGVNAGTSVCMDIFNIVTSGNISTYCMVDQGEEPGISNVEVQPFGTFTSSAGNYNAVSFMSGGNYLLTPFKNTNPTNGVTTFDLVLISKHVLQTELLDSPYKIIAADANRSGSVTTFDMLLLKKLILEIDEEFTNNTSWRFVDANYSFPNPGNPFSSVFPESIAFPGVTPNFDFKGVKIGDVDCSANTYLAPPPAPEIIIVVEDKTVVKDEIVNVDMKVENFIEMEAYQLGIQFNGTVLEQQSINSGDLNRGAEADNFGLTDVESGEIRSVWLYNDASDSNNTIIDTSLVDDSSLFELEFKAKMDYTRSSSGHKLSDLLSLNDDILPNRAYSKKGTHKVRLKFVEEGYFEAKAKERILLGAVKCYPNPAKSEVNFQLDLRTNANVQLQLFDPLGKLLVNQEMNLAAGVQTIDVGEIKSWKSGMYYYTITVGEEVASGKFVKQ